MQHSGVYLLPSIFVLRDFASEENASCINYIANCRIFANCSALYFAGFFLAVSSNTRYQIINGLERLVEASPFAKRVPPIAMAFTVGVRFANNVYGGMQFVDWARMTGVQ